MISVTTSEGGKWHDATDWSEHELSTRLNQGRFTAIRFEDQGRTLIWDQVLASLGEPPWRTT